jgi:hypothetical protein
LADQVGLRVGGVCVLTTPETKFCPGCDRTLPISEFWRATPRPNRPSDDGFQRRCKSCLDAGKSERTRRYHDSGKRYQNSRKTNLARYGLTLDDYNAMLAAQGGVCAVCGQPETSRDGGGRLRSLAVDHCHETGLVRGLLCMQHNRALGLFGDDPALLRAALDYMEAAA